MHRIAVIADIHANLFALEAVVADLAERQVDEVIVAGDLVGRGPQGNAVVHRIAELGWDCVRGNHEDYLLSFCRDDIPESWRHTEQWAASRWMARELDDQAIRFIDSLPFSRRSRLDPNLEVYHGSPNSHSEGIGRWTTDERLREYLDTIDGTVLACAHTHRPLEYQAETGLVVNVGSVGLPFNGDRRAQYAIFEGSGTTWRVTFQQVPYPRERILDYYDSSGFLEEGGVTAKLLCREIKWARPFLVPFLNWAEIVDQPPTSESIDAFLAIYDPAESMAEFFARLSRPSPT